MKTVPAAEIMQIIEIIDDEDAFGERTPSRTTNDSGGPRWVQPTALAVLVAVIGYFVVIAVISPGTATPQRTPDSAPTTTAAVSPPSTTVSSAAKIVSPQFYVADPPPGFTMHYAETLGMGGNAADFISSATAELWATDGATATNGSWFVVSSGTHHSTGRNAYRTVVGDVEVVVEHDPPSGQTRLSFSKGGQEMEITAFGWVDRQLLRLVASVSLADSAIHFDDEFFASDHKRLLDADPMSAVFGLPVAWVGYTTAEPAALAENFSITVAGWPGADRDLVTRFALTNPATFEVGHQSAILGQSAANPTVSIAQWRDGDRLITVRGNLDAQHIEAIAQTVRPSPSADVAEQLAASSAPVAAALAVEPKTIVSGMLADGWGWTIQVSSTQISSRNPDDPAAGYLWWIGQPGDSAKPSETRLSLAGAGASIEPFVEHGRTYVLARVPRSMAGAQLHIDPNGLVPAETLLSDVDPGMGDLFAAYVFLEPVPFTARITDSNGATVASWPLT